MNPAINEITLSLKSEIGEFSAIGENGENETRIAFSRQLKKELGILSRGDEVLKLIGDLEKQNFEDNEVEDLSMLKQSLEAHLDRLNKAYDNGFFRSETVEKHFLDITEKIENKIENLSIAVDPEIRNLITSIDEKIRQSY